jgi:hypothetical protein
MDRGAIPPEGDEPGACRMTHEPTGAAGMPAKRPATPGRELVLAGASRRDGSGADAFLGQMADGDALRRVEGLAAAIRALGIASVGLGVIAAVFIWPKVRLIYLAATLLLAVAAAVAGLALRVNHRQAVRRLGRDPRMHRTLRRTKVHRCQAGLALAAVMFSSGLLIRQAELAAAGRPGEEEGAPLRPDPRVGFDIVAASAVPPGSSYVRADQRLRVASAELAQRPRGRALVLTLEFRNTGTTRRMPLDRVQDVEIPLMRADLYDDLANAYERLEQPEVLNIGRPTSRSALYPGESLRARLVFEPPVPRARALLLRLPENAFTLPDAVKFELDATGLDPDASPPPAPREASAAPG